MSRAAQGLRAWLVQRVTAVYLAVFTLYLIFHFLVDWPTDFAAWSAWLSAPWVAIGMAMYTIAVLLHVWVGIRDVLIDYVKPAGIRLALLGLMAFYLLACGLWTLRALLLTASV